MSIDHGKLLELAEKWPTDRIRLILHEAIASGARHETQLALINTAIRNAVLQTAEAAQDAAWTPERAQRLADGCLQLARDVEASKHDDAAQDADGINWQAWAESFGVPFSGKVGGMLAATHRTAKRDAAQGADSEPTAADKLLCNIIMQHQFQDENRRGRLTIDVETLLNRWNAGKNTLPNDAAQGAVDVTGFGTPPLVHEERTDAEHAYTVTAFDYASSPVGSRDWSLYWRGWWHRSMAYTHPQAAPAQGDDETAWREGWAMAYCGAALYGDDGELQDNRTFPPIDFRHDSAMEIRRKIHERGMRALAASPSPEVGNG